MNKALTYGVLMVWIIAATYVTSAISTYLDDDTFIVNNAIQTIDTDHDDNVERAYSMLDVFWSALTWQIVGLPEFASVILFGVPSFVLVYMITVDILIPFIAAVIPF